MADPGEPGCHTVQVALPRRGFPMLFQSPASAGGGAGIPGIRIRRDSLDLAFDDRSNQNDYALTEQCGLIQYAFKHSKENEKVKQWSKGVLKTQATGEKSHLPAQNERRSL